MNTNKRTALTIVAPGKTVKLADIDPENTGAYSSKADTVERLVELRKSMAKLQERLYAESKRSLLIVVQAMDTGGKDGAIEKLLTGINPAGVEVTSFKVPSHKEMAHDFLWRIHQEAPSRGKIGVWNRSHYEDVLITRVHKLVSVKQCRQRYLSIVEMERLLVENGTTILKFYLHISKEEQKRRLEARLADPAKHWKFNPGDLKERALWPDYMDAYEAALAATSTSYAPWHIVPANHKWGRDIAITECVAATLKKMDPQFPPVTFDPKSIVVV